MSDDRKLFDGFLAKFESCFQSVEVRTISGRKGDEWRNIWTRLDLVPDKAANIARAEHLPSTDSIKAVHEVVPADQIRELIAGIEGGLLRVGTTEVTYPKEPDREASRGVSLRLLPPRARHSRPPELRTAPLDGGNSAT